MIRVHYYIKRVDDDGTEEFLTSSFDIVQDTREEEEEDLEHILSQMDEDDIIRIEEY